MSWTTPVIVEVCVGMEVTSYASAEFNRFGMIRQSS